MSIWVSGCVHLYHKFKSLKPQLKTPLLLSAMYNNTSFKMNQFKGYNWNDFNNIHITQYHFHTFRIVNFLLPFPLPFTHISRYIIAAAACLVTILLLSVFSIFYFTILLYCYRRVARRVVIIVIAEPTMSTSTYLLFVQI